MSSPQRRHCGPEEAHLALSSGARDLALGQALHLPTPHVATETKVLQSQVWQMEFPFWKAPTAGFPLLTLGPLAQSGFGCAEQLESRLERCRDPPALGPAWAPWGPWLEPFSPLRPQSCHIYSGWTAPHFLFFFF